MAYRITIMHITHNIHSPSPRTEILEPYETLDEAKIVAKALYESFLSNQHLISYQITGSASLKTAVRTP